MPSVTYIEPASSGYELAFDFPLTGTSRREPAGVDARYCWRCGSHQEFERGCIKGSALRVPQIIGVHGRDGTLTPKTARWISFGVPVGPKFNDMLSPDTLRVSLQ